MNVHTKIALPEPTSTWEDTSRTSAGAEWDDEEARWCVQYDDGDERWVIVNEGWAGISGYVELTPQQLRAFGAACIAAANYQHVQVPNAAQ